MIPRSRGSGRRARIAFACLSVPGLVCALGVAGCGSGDDSTVAGARAATRGGAVVDAAANDDDVVDAGTDAGGPDEDVVGSDATVEAGGVPVATFARSRSTSGTWRAARSGTQGFSVTNGGTGMLAVTATTTGSAFSVSSPNLSLAPGAMGALTLTAAVPGSSSAGTPLTGSLDLFTNDPTQPKVSIPLSATPMGASVQLVSRSHAGRVPDHAARQTGGGHRRFLS